MIAPTMSDLLTAFQTHLASNAHATRTITTYTKITTAFLNSFSKRPPVRTDIEDFLARRRLDGQPRAPTTRNQEFAALRSLAAYAVEEKHWSDNPTKGIKFTRKVRREPDFFDEDELDLLFRTARDHPPAGERSQTLAILGLLSQRGLRVHELVKLNVSQVDRMARKLLRVRGKGGTLTNLKLNAQTMQLLVPWLRDREARAPAGEEALFLSSRGTRLSIRTVENWFVKLRVAMGTAKKLTPHTLRHSFATLQLLNGADLPTVSGNMRHADVNSTLWYLHLIDRRKDEAIDRLGATIPQDLLDAIQAESAANAPVEPPPNETAPSPPESPATPRAENLDDQYRLVAA